MKLIYYFTITSVLSGCATAIISNDEVKNYANLKPDEFVKKRFFEDEQRPVLNAISDAVKKFGDMMGNKREVTDEFSPTISSDGSVVAWTAYYTNLNFVQLLRPNVELKRYCEARGAKMKMLENYDRDLLADFKKNPAYAFFDAYSRVNRMLISQNAYVGVEELRDGIATQVAHEMFDAAVANNKRINSAYSTEALTYAQRLGAFGVFHCENKIPQESWYASILPVFFEPADSKNQLLSASARIAIKVYVAPPEKLSPRSTELKRTSDSPLKKTPGSWK